MSNDLRARLRKSQDDLERRLKENPPAETGAPAQNLHSDRYGEKVPPAQNLHGDRYVKRESGVATPKNPNDRPSENLHSNRYGEQVAPAQNLHGDRYGDDHDEH